MERGYGNVVMALVLTKSRKNGAGKKKGKKSGGAEGGAGDDAPVKLTVLSAHSTGARHASGDVVYCPRTARLATADAVSGLVDINPAIEVYTVGLSAGDVTAFTRPRESEDVCGFSRIAHGLKEAYAGLRGAEDQQARALFAVVPPALSNTRKFADFVDFVCIASVSTPSDAAKHFSDAALLEFIEIVAASGAHAHTEARSPSPAKLDAGLAETAGLVGAEGAPERVQGKRKKSAKTDKRGRRRGGKGRGDGGSPA